MVSGKITKIFISKPILAPSLLQFLEVWESLMKNNEDICGQSEYWTHIVHAIEVPMYFQMLLWSLACNQYQIKEKNLSFWFQLHCNSLSITDWKQLSLFCWQTIEHWLWVFLTMCLCRFSFHGCWYSTWRRVHNKYGTWWPKDAQWWNSYFYFILTSNNLQETSHTKEYLINKIFLFSHQHSNK